MRSLYKGECKKIFTGLMIAGVLLLAALLGGCEGKDTQVSATVSSDAGDSGDSTGQEVEYIYGIPMNEKAAVVTENVADIFNKPDVKSERISQVLCNQPVSVFNNDGGWAKVKTVNGITGWIKSRYISDDLSSLTGRVYTYKIIVTSREKTVNSGPDGGITLVNAQMGTEFFAFNNIEDSYEVFLPGNRTGWLGGSGIIRIPVGDVILVTNAEDFASTALRFKGTSFMINGMSSMGIDSASLVYICARINGINLPVNVEGQMSTGTAVELEDAKAGDLVFMSGTGENDMDSITCSGIYIGDGSFIYAGRKTGYAAIGDINRENPDGIAVAVRRIFN